MRSLRSPGARGRGPARGATATPCHRRGPRVGGGIRRALPRHGVRRRTRFGALARHLPRPWAGTAGRLPAARRPPRGRGAHRDSRGPRRGRRAARHRALRRLALEHLRLASGRGEARRLRRCPAGGARIRRRPGKLRYLAPERLQGGPLTRAVDVFGLGAALFELLTGARAFPVHIRSGGGDVAGGVRRPPSAARPEVPAAVDALVVSALAADLAERPASAGDMAAALEELFDERMGTRSPSPHWSAGCSDPKSKA